MTTLLIAPGENEVLSVTPGTPFDLVVQSGDGTDFAFDAAPVVTLYDAFASAVGVCPCVDVTSPASATAPVKTFAITVPLGTSQGEYLAPAQLTLPVSLSDGTFTAQASITVPSGPTDGLYSVQLVGTIGGDPYSYTQQIRIGDPPPAPSAPPPPPPPPPPSPPPPPPPAPPPTGPYALYGVLPSLDSARVVVPGLFYWDVTSVLIGVDGSVSSSSQASPVQSVYLAPPTDISMEGQAAGPGTASFPALRQLSPLIPVQRPRVVRISPSPGFIHQDTSPE